MGISNIVRNWFIEPVIKKLETMEAQMAQDQAALDSALTALGTIITSEDAGIVSLVDEVTALIAKVQTNPGGDFTNEVTALNAMAADIKTQADNIQASVASAKGVTGS
jgi:hypothetical protein